MLPLGFYLWLGLFALGRDFRHLIAPLRNSGVLKPIGEGALITDAIAGIGVMGTALLCVPFALVKHGWRRIFLLVWPMVGFVLTFAFDWWFMVGPLVLVLIMVFFVKDWRAEWPSS